MAKSGVVRRYAQAVFDIAVSQNRLEGWGRDLQTIDDTVKQPDLLATLTSVRIPFENKHAVLKQVFDGHVDPMAINLVALLTQRNRLDIVSALAEDYHALLDERLGIARAIVTTAVPLDDREEAEVRERLGLVTGKEVRLTTNVDPTILGGLVARIGDKLIDGSTRSRLIALRQRLAG